MERVVDRGRIRSISGRVTDRGEIISMHGGLCVSLQYYHQ
jgi:hypothetical protein